MNKHSKFFKVTLLTFILVISPIIVLANSTAAVLFLLIEPGSAPGAMGQAYVAAADDGFAQFWNPGAMAFNRKQQAALMHVNWFGDIFDDMYYEYLGYNQYYPELYGNVGYHVTFLTLGTQDRLNEQGEHIGVFSSFDVAAGASYGYQYSDNLGLGMNFKIIYSQLAPEETGFTGGKGSGLSYAFDIAMLRKNLFLNGLSWGINLQNIGPNVTYINNTQSDPMPMNFRMGFSYRAFENALNKVTVNADMNKLLANNDFIFKRLITAWYDDGGFMSKIERESTIFGVGAEYEYLKLIALRAGYMYDKGGHIMGPSFGFGLQYTFSNRWHTFFDFAMQPAGELTDYNKTFSLGIEF